MDKPISEKISHPKENSKSEHGSFAKKLLERTPENSYISEWTHLLMKEKDVAPILAEGSVVVFRLHKEWLALSTLYFTEVAERRTIHRIPHRNSPILLGVVNLGGQLKICVDINHLIQTEDFESHVRSDTATYRRMLAIQKEEDSWVFPVDEINGVFQFELNQIENVPVTLAKSTANYLKGVISLEDRKIGLLDEELLFFSLKRCLL